MRLACKILLIIALCCSIHQRCCAEFDLSGYQEVEFSKDSLPVDFYYPEFFKETESLSYRNIVAEIRFRLEFVAGIRPEPRQYNCFKMQKRIEKSLERMKEALGKLPFKRIDDELLFNETSPLNEYLKPMPRKATLRCSYHAVGDADNGGAIFCRYHGPADDSEFYTDQRAQFDAARPMVTSFEIVEFLIFFPALLILPVTWYLMKKVLEKN